MAASPNIKLIVGEDDYLVEATARKAIEAAVPPDLRAAAVETVDGNAGNAEEQLASLRACAASVQTPPFLDPVKLTWWRGVSFLPGGGRGGKIADAVKTALEKFAAQLAASPLPENQTLVITAPKLLKTSVFAKTLKTVAETVEFAAAGRSRDRQADALARIPDLAAAEGLSFTPGAAEAFVAKAGTDTRTLVSELAKMRTYLGADRATVTRQDVADIVCAGGEEPELWEITDAIAQRDPAKLLATLAAFDGKSAPGILIATITEKFFRELIVCRDALDNGWLTPYGTWSKTIPPRAVEDLDAAGLGPNTAKSPWLLKKAAANARRFSLYDLRVARYLMLNAREKLVSSSADDASVITALLRIVRTQPRAPGGRTRRVATAAAGSSGQ